MREKNCLVCGVLFSRDQSSQKDWETKAKFCSRDCGYEGRKIKQGKDNGNWQGGKLEKVCVVCKKDFQCWKYQASRKCCSQKCKQEYTQSDEFRDNLREKNLGKIILPSTRQKLSDAQIGKRTGKENNSWKGNDVGYRAMHEWINREKGTPDICEHCGLIGSIAKKRLVWANKSHEYKRDINDWMRLCYRCHRKYDFPNEKHPK